MSYPYEQIFAGDPSAPERVAVNGVVTIFEPGDATMAPLTITTLDGLPLANPMQVNESGFGPAFQHETLDQVAWSGGGLFGLFSSHKGMKEVAVAAQQGASAAAINAEQSRLAAEEAVRNAQAPSDEAVDAALERADIPATIQQAVSGKLDKGEASDTFAVKPDNGGKPVGKSELAFNVRDFGAKGDGTSDDTAAIQAAMNAVGEVGGGTLYFPAGEYYTFDAVSLVSNVTITGSNAILVKKPGVRGYACFVGSSGTTKGYGAGPSNITIHGLKFRGKFKDTSSVGRSLCAFALHHSQDVLVYDCEFVEASRGGHLFDLQGCRRVTIRDSIFRGFDANGDPGLFYNEDIQLDNSTRGGGSFSEQSDSCFDGLPCTDIQVEGNQWLEYTVNGIVHPAGNPIGTHATVADFYHKRIRFINNYVGPGLSDTTSYVNGRLHFLNWDDVIINGNTFDAGGREMAAIHAYHTARTFPVDNVHLSGGSSVAVPTPMMNKNITVSGNVFRNFKTTNASNVGVVHFVDVGSTSGAFHARIHVLNNFFESNKTLPVSTNDSMNLIWLASCQDFEVSGNKGNEQRRGVLLLRCRNGSVSSNAFRDSSNTVVGVTDSADVEVHHNDILGLTGSPCLAVSGGARVRVSDNAFRSSSPPATAVRITGGAVQCIATGNLIMPALGGAIDVGIQVLSASTLALSANNMFSSAVGRTVSVSSDSTLVANTGEAILPV